MTSELAFVLPAVAGVTAGLVWSLLGLWSKWRSGSDDATVDYKKLRKNVIVGAGTGIAAYLVGIAGGTDVGAINSFDTFVIGVGAYFPLVVAADKLLVKKEE